MSYITTEDRKAFEAVWSEASDDPDSFMHLPPVFDVLAVKSETRPSETRP